MGRKGVTVQSKGSFTPLFQQNFYHTIHLLTFTAHLLAELLLYAYLTMNNLRAKSIFISFKTLLRVRAISQQLR